MNLLRFLPAAAALSACPVLTSSGADPAGIVPGNAVGYMETCAGADMMKLADHPVLKAVPAEKLAELYMGAFYPGGAEGYREEMDRLFKALGTDFNGLMQMTGRSAISVHDLEIGEKAGPEGFNIELSIVSELKADDAFMDKYYAAIAESFRMNAEKQSDPAVKAIYEAMLNTEITSSEYKGVKLRIFKLKGDDFPFPEFLRELAIAFTDGHLIGATGEEEIKGMIDRLKSGGAEGSLAASKFYKDDKAETGPVLGAASIHLKPLLELAQEVIRKDIENGGTSGPVNPLKVWTALGVDKLESAALTFSATPEAIDLTGYLRWSEKPGLIDVPALPGAGEPPAFLPQNTASVSWTRIDVEKTFENALRLLDEVNPAASGLVQMSFEEMKKTEGVDMRNDIIGQIGPAVWTAVMKQPGEIKKREEFAESLMTSAMGLYFGGHPDITSWVIGAGVKDRKTLQGALDKAPDDDSFEKRDYQGYKIWTLRSEEAGIPFPFSFSWVLTDDWVLLSFGRIELLESILGRFASGAKGEGPAVASSKGLSSMRGGEIAASASTLSAAAGPYLEYMDAMFQAMPPGQLELKGELKEMAKLLDAPVRVLSKAWIGDKSSEYRSRLTAE